MTDASKKPAQNPVLVLAAIRKVHVYISVLIAPSLLFFCFTGALQLFSLHEAHGDYTPPALIEKLGTLHKDQKFEAHHKHPPAPKAGAPGPDADHDADHDHGPAQEGGPKLGVVLLKWIFLAVALGTIVTTGLGLWMALAFNREKALLAGLLVAGTLLPVLAVFLS